jgi:hypothetical protein
VILQNGLIRTLDPQLTRVGRSAMMPLLVAAPSTGLQSGGARGFVAAMLGRPPVMAAIAPGFCASPALAARHGNGLIAFERDPAIYTTKPDGGSAVYVETPSSTWRRSSSGGTSWR